MELENKEIIDFAERNSFKASPQVLNTVINQNSLGGADWSENDSEAKSYIKNRTHWKEYEDKILVEDEEVVFEAMSDEDWGGITEEERYLSCFLYPSVDNIDFNYSDFEVIVDGNICNIIDIIDRSSGEVKLLVLLSDEETISVFLHKKVCGGGYVVDIYRYKNLSGNFSITIKEKIPTYFPIDDNYLVSKLSVLTATLDGSNKIYVPLNFRNGIIFVTTNDSNKLFDAGVYSIQFGTDRYHDAPKRLCKLSDGCDILQGSSPHYYFPTCALIYVNNEQTCYLMNPVIGQST